MEVHHGYFAELVKGGQMREKIGELMDLFSEESLETLGLGGMGFFNRAIWKREEYVKLKDKLKNALAALIIEEVKNKKNP